MNSEWVRLYVTVEGPTEKKFADETLRPHLALFSIDLRPRIVITNRKLGARGRGKYYETIQGDLARLMSEDASSKARFSTMVDLYALPHHFPGKADAEHMTEAVTKVEHLEAAWATAVADRRFIPFIQLHEFEALLYCDLAELEKRIENATAGITALRREVGHLAPEAINEGPTTAPSKRIIRHVPAYQFNKPRVGAPAASAIGLSVLRQKCPHFSQWITKLENLGSPIQA